MDDEKEDATVIVVWRQRYDFTARKVERAAETAGMRVLRVRPPPVEEPSE